MHPLPIDTAVKIIPCNQTASLIQTFGNSGRVVGYTDDYNSCIVYFFESQTTVTVPSDCVEVWLSIQDKVLLPIEFQTWLDTVSPADF